MKLYKNIFNVMANTRVKSVTIANFATVIIPHLIAERIVAQTTSMKDSLPGHAGASTPCGTTWKKKPRRFMENMVIQFIRKYHASW